MVNLKINKPKTAELVASIRLNGSKSISNRVLLIQALSNKEIGIKNLSNAADTTTMLRLLQHEKDSILDAGDAGTAYRFLTAYLAIRPGKQFLTGTKRMLERPIAVLVDTLRGLGAQIRYAGREGFPPLQIGSPNFNHEIQPELHIQSTVSSQYISALLLIAPSLAKGLVLYLEGEPVSEPYINMTLELMKIFGAECKKQGNKICVEAGNYEPINFEVESDWSAASYYYAFAALAEGKVNLKLSTLHKNSLQGDACIADIMEVFAIKTEYLEDGSILIKKEQTLLPDFFEYDFTNCPDIAQTLAVVVAGLGLRGRLTGLQTLLIKETDRIAALKTELEKLGAIVTTNQDSLEIEKAISPEFDTKNLIINTYNDHRMAMAFAPLVLRLGALKFDNREVVAKSYPKFWDDLTLLGLKI